MSFRFDPASLPPQQSTKASALVSAAPSYAEEMREAVILAIFMAHPALIDPFMGELETLEFLTDDHRRIRGALLVHHDVTDPERLREEIASTLGPAPLEKLLSQRHVQIAPALSKTADLDKARTSVSEELAKLHAERATRREIEEALHDVEAFPDEGLTWRLSQAAEARNRAGRGDNEDRGEYDVSENGARLKRDERDAFAALLDQIGFGKGKGSSS